MDAGFVLNFEARRSGGMKRRLFDPGQVRLFNHYGPLIGHFLWDP